jgi:hypothetical protein
MLFWRHPSKGGHKLLGSLYTSVSFCHGITVKDDKGNDIPIPAHARALLEPFVNVMGNEREADRKVYLLTFIPEHDRLNGGQLQAIGRVATTWSVLERVLGILLSRLAMAPEFSAFALTKDLGLDNQIKAIKTLISLHIERYHQMVVTPGLEDVITNMIPDFFALKEKRNILTHTVWFTMGKDKISGLRSRPVSMSKAAANEVPEWTISEINDVADQIQKLSDAMFVVAQILPAVDEAQHVKSLSQDARHLPPDTRQKPEDPR